ncbi:fluoride efflux transporter FluC [Demequina flava]|uniref:fluoride efflux transporter FluC n=1 Tax=Demequina flava TaxID=1095025 RepID=UPI0009E33418|nr:CrcB family protein [Demequina flava]
MPPVLLVFLGGAIGGGVRILLDELIPSVGAVPWDLLTINVVGSAVLGAVAGWSIIMGKKWWQPMVGPGMLGGFTTFSSVAALTWSAQAGIAQGLLVLAGTMVVAVLAAAVGWRWGIRRADSQAAEL